MYVCICNAVSDRQIRSHLDVSRRTVADICRVLGIKIQCGRCVRAVKTILDEAQFESAYTAAIPDFARVE
jgi:bacterioferritin-associated ferredoxin